MAVVVVGGSGKDVGKTALVCAIILALRDFEWTAVKITGHDYSTNSGETGDTSRSIREESNAEEETDTARYLAAGAQRALLVTRVGAEIPMEEIRIALGSDRNVIFESNRIVDAVKPDLCLALVGSGSRKGSFDRLLRFADAAIIVAGAKVEGLPERVRRFEVERTDRMSSELVTWLRERLDQH